MNNDNGFGSFNPTWNVPPMNSSSPPTTTPTPTINQPQENNGIYNSWVIIFITGVIAFLFLLFTYLFLYDSSASSDSVQQVIIKESDKLLGQLTNYLTSPAYSDPIESA